MDWVAVAETIREETLEIFKHLHQYPELSEQEHETTRYIAAKLSAMGLEVKTFQNMTGVVGYLPGPPGRPTIAVRADIDALPVQENSASPFPSRVPGVMHACGHDFHATVALGVAKLLSGARDRLPFSVKFIFQPAEETNVGAKAMIEAGVLDNPPVDFIIGIHANPDLQVGQVGLTSGPVMAAESNFEITITGKSSHGSQPHKGADAVLAASATVTALQSIVSRFLDPLETAVVSVGVIKAGKAKNIIADQAQLAGTVRYFKKEAEQLVQEKLTNIVRYTTETYDCKGHLDFFSEQSPVVNDPSLIETIRPSLIQVFGEKNIISVGPSMASEDYSYFLQVVQGVFLWLGTSSAKNKGVYPLHNQGFCIEEDAIVSGISGICVLIDALTSMEDTIFDGTLLLS
jgi:amidohydrolase